MLDKFKKMMDKAEETNIEYGTPTFNTKGIKDLTIMCFCPECGEQLIVKDMDDRSGELTPSYENSAWIDISFEKCKCKKHLLDDEIEVNINMFLNSEFQKKIWKKNIKNLLNSLSEAMTATHKKNKINYTILTKQDIQENEGC